MTQPCSLCQVGEASAEFHVCSDCSDKLGLRALPPSTRPAVPCVRCNATRFVRVLPREHSSYVEQDSVISGGGVVTNHRIAEPMTLTVKPSVEDRWIRKGRKVDEPKITGGVGTLETFVCLGCGFVEWYCQDPKAIPIGHEYNSEIVDVGA
jgi:hypothetical protein